MKPRSKEPTTTPGSDSSEPLTIENLRTCKGYENISDAEAKEIVTSLKTLVSLLMETALKQTSYIDNQEVVYLNKPKRAA